MRTKEFKPALLILLITVLLCNCHGEEIRKEESHGRNTAEPASVDQKDVLISASDSSGDCWELSVAKMIHRP
ncbi:MAG TPA: hypothetical protein VL728_07130 [Cyclobacteriaceae bacterium]|jgi:hypothetical protein|nr:hypothetical protein [Cyclobacteriaceae bacterium]